MNRSQNRASATQITTEMNSRSNQFVSIGRKPGFFSLFRELRCHLASSFHRAEGQAGNDVTLHH